PWSCWRIRRAAWRRTRRWRCATTWRLLPVACGDLPPHRLNTGISRRWRRVEAGRLSFRPDHAPVPRTMSSAPDYPPAPQRLAVDYIRAPSPQALLGLPETLAVFGFGALAPATSALDDPRYLRVPLSPLREAAAPYEV